MDAMIPTLPTLAVSTIYCVWFAYQRTRLLQQQRVLRERVAYMLWMVASQMD
jgi:hypothetical protein